MTRHLERHRGRKAPLVAIAGAASAALIGGGMANAAFAASPVPVGAYTGMTDEGQSSVYTIDFDVDADGRVGNLEMLGSVCGTPGVQYVGMPWTPVAPDGTFDVSWVASDITFEFRGTIGTDGVADGEARATMPGVCSGSRITNWEATNEGGVVVPTPDPTVSLSATSLTETELAETGLTIVGADFPASSAVSLEIDGAAADAEQSDADGRVEFQYSSADLAPGSHTVRLAAGTLSASTSFTVVADPVVLDPQIALSATTLSESEMAETGLTASGTGFAASTPATLTIAGQQLATGATDAAGAVQLSYTGVLPVGTHPVQITAGGLSAGATLTITADPVVPVPDPQIAVSATELTQSELSETGVTVTGTGFVADSAVELEIDGAVVDSDTAATGGGVSFVYTATDAAVGTYAVRLVSGTLSAATTFAVVADEVEPEASIELALSEIEQSELAANGIPVAVSGLPAGVTYSVLLDGQVVAERTVGADGTEEFLFTAADIAPGAHTLRIQAGTAFAEAGFTVLEDVVEPQPEITLSATELTQTELATTGLVVTGEGFAVETPLALHVDGVVVDQAFSGADGTVELSYRASDVAPGTYSLTVEDGPLLRAGMGIAAILASAEFTVLADPAAPAPTLTLDLGTIATGDLADAGVVIRGAGFEPGTTVSLLFAGEVVLDGIEVAADGTVVATLQRADVAPGEYAVALESGDLLASGVLSVTADAVIPAPIPDPVPAPAPAPAPAAPAAGDALANTGAETAGFAGLALALLAAGAALVAARRIRARQA